MGNQNQGDFGSQGQGPRQGDKGPRQGGQNPKQGQNPKTK